MAEAGEGGYRLLSKNWAEYNKQTGHVLELERISHQDLERYQLKAYIAFYFRRFSIQKMRKLLQFIDPWSLMKEFWKRISTGRLWKHTR